MSLGALTESELESIRMGSAPNPSINTVLALAQVFSVAPSCFLKTREKRMLLNEETVDALNDQTSLAILRKSSNLPERERTAILCIIDQFERLHRDS